MWAWLLACREDPVTLTPLDPKVRPDHTIPTVLSSTPCDECGGDCLVEEVVYDAGYHVTGGVAYLDVPPAGGPHDPCWTDFGVHVDPVDDEHWVHNLEHGAVVFAYACEDCDADVAELEAVAVSSPWGIAMPYPALAEEGELPFAALSWGFRRTSACFDADAATAFLAEHEDQAPESVPSGPGTGCM